MAAAPPSCPPPPTSPGTESSTEASAFARRWSSTSTSRPSSVSSQRSRRSTSPSHWPRSTQSDEALPNVPEVACFDTAFHDAPAAGRHLRTTARVARALRLRRYGFHGLSHAYAARAAGDARRIVTCHLGAGASLCRARRPLGRHYDGLHAARGARDGHELRLRGPRSAFVAPAGRGPGARRDGRGARARVGLLGLSGTADMRALLARDDADASWRSASTSTGCEPVSQPWSRASAVSTLSYSRAASGELRQVRELACAGLEFLGVRRRERRCAC